MHLSKDRNRSETCNHKRALTGLFLFSYSQENKWRSHDSGDKTTRVDLLARNAIKMLNNLFQKSDPRVRGQTVEEVELLRWNSVLTNVTIIERVL